MSDWNSKQEIIKALLSLAVSLGTLAATLATAWAFGQRLSFHWSVRQKRRELQMSASQQFYSAYGEFFSIWKLWSRIDRKASNFDDRRWELHRDAATAEATVEGTLVKISSELVLKQTQIIELALFRQGFQQLRQSIREDQELNWRSSQHPEYVAFKCLATRIALILAADWSEHRPIVSRAEDQLLEITDNRWETVWKKVAINGLTAEIRAASSNEPTERFPKR